jgi:hypothetical protein
MPAWFAEVKNSGPRRLKDLGRDCEAYHGVGPQVRTRMSDLPSLASLFSSEKWGDSQLMGQGVGSPAQQAAALRALPSLLCWAGGRAPGGSE